MKGNGLSSTSRTFLKKLGRQSAYASTQESFLAAKERQRALRLQAEKAQQARNARAVSVNAIAHAIAEPANSELVEPRANESTPRTCGD